MNVRERQVTGVTTDYHQGAQQTQSLLIKNANLGHIMNKFYKSGFVNQFYHFYRFGRPVTPYGFLHICQYEEVR